MLTVHHLRLSQSERIVWLCEELGIDYELKLYDRREDNRMAPDEYKALHPMGIAPVITDGDLTLGESGAIVDYICAKHGGGDLIPAADDPDFPGHIFWFHFTNGTFLATGMMQLVLAFLGESDNDAAGFVRDRAKKVWQMADDRLAEAEYFGGRQMTTADIMMVYGLTTGRAFRGTSLDAYPNIRAYLQRIGERSAYRRAMEKAEPGMEPMLS